MNVVSCVILCWHVIYVIFREDLFGDTVFGEVKLFQYPEEPIAVSLLDLISMMTSSNGNNFPVTGPLCMEFTGHW